MTPEEYKDRLIQLEKLMKSLGVLKEGNEKLFEILCGNVVVQKLFNDIQKFIDAGTGNNDPVPPYLKMVEDYETFKDKVVNANVPQALKPLYDQVIAKMNQMFFQPMDKLLAEIGDVVYYFGCNYYLKNATEGFDLMYTTDGVNFEIVTQNGLGDKNNHGVRTLVSADAGKTLYIGTANPYYGAQFWKIQTGELEEEEYTVHYDLNGGEGDIPDATCVSGDTFTITMDEPTLKDKNFNGWEYDGQVYQPGDTFTMPGKDVTLVAKWKTDGQDEYTVHYDLNGGKGNIPDESYASGDTFKITTQEPTKANKLFGGWEYNGKTYKPGDTFTMPGKNVEFAAKWNNGTGDNEGEYTVHYNLNGGEGNIPDATYASGETVTVTRVIPTKANNTFKGWEYDGDVYEGGDTFVMPEKTVTLVAQWKENEQEAEKYTVSYKLNGGEGNIPSASYEAGQTFKITNTTPTKKDHSFQGWEYDGKTYQAGASFTMPAKNVAFSAQWKKNDDNTSGGGGGGGGGVTSYTLTYRSNGGTSYAQESYTSGKVVKLDKEPVRSGYEFTGWYAEEELTEKITEIKMTSNKTVYAGWKKVEATETTGGSNGEAPIPAALNGDEHFAYIVGYEDGTIKPQNNITRAEVATIFFRLLKDEVRDENLATVNAFTDVPANEWYNTPVSTIAALGIIKGRTVNTFDPSANITRAEFAAICARFDESIEEGSSDFTDINGHWAKTEVERAATLGWISGYADDTFHPDQYITRAEAMAMINRVLHRNPETAEDLLDDMRVWTDNLDTNEWYYLVVQEAGNSHEYERKDNGKEYWTELTQDPDWSQYK